MTDRQDDEYRALRATIQARGTVRTCIFVGGLSVWAALAVTLFVLSSAPLAVVFPLLELAATFEAVFALHVGVERLGRYLQVFHHDRWEQVAMSFGAPLAGTGADPLFTVLFALAVLGNFIPVLLVEPVPSELIVIGVLHAALLVRLVIARRAASRQRGVDLERFKQLLGETQR